MRKLNLIFALLASAQAYATGDIADVDPGKEVKASVPQKAVKKTQAKSGAGVIQVAPGKSMPAAGNKVVVTTAEVQPEDIGQKDTKAPEANNQPMKQQAKNGYEAGAEMTVVSDKEAAAKAGGVTPLAPLGTTNDKANLAENGRVISEMVSKAVSAGDVNGDIPVSKNGVNVLGISNKITRIVTPFTNPFIATNEPEKYFKWSAVGNALYLSRPIAEPLPIFISEEGGGGESIALTIVAQDIPSRELTLKPDSTFKNLKYKQPGSEAQNIEKASTYTSGVMAIFKEIALGNVPAGFTMSEQRMFPISCEVPGFEIRQGQYMRGADTAIGVLVARNISNIPLDFEESDCYRKGVIAVAAFPRVRMKPAEETELYIMARDIKIENKSVTRPVLVR